MQPISPDLQGEYTRLRPRLLSILGHLKKRGFPLVPSLSLDIVHDFFLEAWPGLEERFNPQVGSWDSYVAGAFVRFARNRIIAEARLNRAIPWTPSLHEEYDEAVIASDIDLRRVRTALSLLPEDERQLLYERFVDDKTERQIARENKHSRYQTRNTLLSALAGMAVRLQTLADSEDARVANALFVQRETLSAAARTLGMTVAQVRAARARVLALVAQGLES